VQQTRAGKQKVTTRDGARASKRGGRWVETVPCCNEGEEDEGKKEGEVVEREKEGWGRGNEQRGRALGGLDDGHLVVVVVLCGLKDVDDRDGGLGCVGSSWGVHLKVDDGKVQLAVFEAAVRLCVSVWLCGKARGEGEEEEEEEEALTWSRRELSVSHH